MAFTLTINLDAAIFDPNAQSVFSSRMATLVGHGITTEAIVLNVTAGSLLVATEILTVAQPTADSIGALLAGKTNAELSDALGVPISDISATDQSVQAFDGPRPPPTSPPPPSPEAPPPYPPMAPAHILAFDMAYLLWALGALAGLLTLSFYCWMRAKAYKKRKEQRAMRVSQASPLKHKVSYAASRAAGGGLYPGEHARGRKVEANHHRRTRARTCTRTPRRAPSRRPQLTSCGRGLTNFAAAAVETDYSVPTDRFAHRQIGTEGHAAKGTRIS